MLFDPAFNCAYVTVEEQVALASVHVAKVDAPSLNVTVPEIATWVPPLVALSSVAAVTVAFSTVLPPVATVVGFAVSAVAVGNAFA